MTMWTDEIKKEYRTLSHNQMIFLTEIKDIIPQQNIGVDLVWSTKLNSFILDIYKIYPNDTLPEQSLTGYIIEKGGKRIENEKIWNPMILDLDFMNPRSIQKNINILIPILKSFKLEETTDE